MNKVIEAYVAQERLRLLLNTYKTLASSDAFILKAETDDRRYQAMKNLILALESEIQIEIKFSAKHGAGNLSAEDKPWMIDGAPQNE